MIAHRGVSGLERENTNSAFVAAGSRSYFGIETDIHRTADGKFVLIHDDTTGRVAVDDLAVEKSTFDTLRSLILTDRDGLKGRSDLRIPTLSEYININKKYGKVGVLELKNAMDEADISRICGEIEELGYMNGVIFISFSYENLVCLRKRYPKQTAQFLTGEYDNQLIARLREYDLGLDICFNALNAQNTAALKEAGITINCWTVDDPDRAAELIGWGVDMITSNILE